MARNTSVMHTENTALFMLLCARSEHRCPEVPQNEKDELQYVPTCAIVKGFISKQAII